jgi:phage-related minor tail protein
MVRAIIAWFNKLISPIKSVLSTIAGFFSGFASKLKAFANLFAQGVRDANAFFAALPGKIKNALSNLASTLFNFGMNAMQGFVNGLASVGQRAIDKARDIANSVKNIVKGALGIGSPSKVFKEYGRNVVQGFVLGITGEQSSLAKTMDTFGNKPRFEQINGSPADPLVTRSTGSSALNIQNYYANDNVDPWRQAEDLYFLVTSRGGVA